MVKSSDDKNKYFTQTNKDREDIHRESKYRETGEKDI